MNKSVMVGLVVSLLASGLQGFGAPPAFEVASVKPSDGRTGIDMKTYPKRLTSTCSLHQLIEAAYSVERWQVSGGPAWMDDLFDVEATTAEDLSGDPDRVVALGRPAPRKMMLMLQTLLAERFNMKVHRETREDNVYQLVVSKNGPKLQTPEDTTGSYIRTGRTGSVYAAALTEIITGHNASMEQLAHYLSGNVRRPVADETKLTGKYDFRIEFAPENSPAENVPSFFTAVQEDAGLKLSAVKGPVEFLVVDHADRPSAN